MFHLAQYNIARMKFDNINAAEMLTFVAQLDELNALAETAAGFVWRYISADSNDSTSDRPYPDEKWIINFSVWEDVESLFQYAFYSDHVRAYRDRLDWFEKPTEPIAVLWWVPAGHIPTIEEAMDKLNHLRQNGASAEAFTFKNRFPPPETGA